MQTWELDKTVAPVHQPQVLSSEDGATRAIAITLPAGERLQEHQVHEEALLFLVDGEMAICAGADERRLSAPALAQFAAAERHEVVAVSDCRLVLCLAPWPGPGHPNLTSRAANA